MSKAVDEAKAEVVALNEALNAAEAEAALLAEARERLAEAEAATRIGAEAKVPLKQARAAVTSAERAALAVDGLRARLAEAAEEWRQLRVAELKKESERRRIERAELQAKVEAAGKALSEAREAVRQHGLKPSPSVAAITLDRMDADRLLVEVLK